MSLSPSSEAMELLAGDALHLLARAPPLPYPNRRSCWVVVAFFRKKMFVWLFYLFFKKNVCRVYFGHSAKSLPSVRQKTLGNVCLPIKIHRVSFAECDTRQTLCRVFFRFYRVPGALGKSPDSRSARGTPATDETGELTIAT